MTSDADPVMRLGRSLADALDASDVVGRWMSHHLADLLTKCEAQPEDELLAIQTRELILKLWEHKAGGRFKHAPFTYLQPVLAALGRLEPDPPPWAFYGTLSSEEHPTSQDLVSYPVLQAACEMDHEFGQVVRLAVALAAEEAIAREEPWVVAGAALGDTEMDSAFRHVQQLLRRYRMLAAQYSTDVDPGDESSEQDAAEQTTGSEPPAGIDGLGEPSKNEVLYATLRAAIRRCSDLLEQMGELSSQDRDADGQSARAGRGGSACV